MCILKGWLANINNSNFQRIAINVSPLQFKQAN